MSVSSPGFLGLLLVTMMAFHALGGARPVVLLAADAWFLVAQSPSLAALVPLLGFTLAGFAAAILLSQAPRPSLRILALSCLMLWFVCLRRYWFMPREWWPQLACTVGLSYIFFRTLHLLVEAGDTVTLRLQDLPAYLRYQLGFRTLLAGPIQHWDAFLVSDRALSQFTLDKELCADALLRLSWGLLKLVLIAPWILREFSTAQPAQPLWLAALSVVFVTWIYMNFSGYMDVVVGAARLLGYRLPENFNQPWMAANFVDFWSRWHITLSFFFRDYVFYPLAQRRVSWIGCSLLVFFLMGLWHGTTPMFVYFGVLLGLGVVLQRAVLKRSGHLPGALAVVYFCTACVAIWPSSTDLTIACSVWSAMASPSGLLGTALALGGVVVLRLGTQAWNGLPSRWPGMLVQTALAVNVVALAALYRLLSTTGLADIYYARF